MLRFAANLSMMFNEWDFLDRFAAAADAGFDIVEFMFPYDFSPDDIAARVQRYKLEVALFNFPPGDAAKDERGLAALPDRRDEFRAHVDRAIVYAKATGAKRMHMMAGRTPVNAASNACFRENAAHAAEKAAAIGATVVIEPLNGRDVPGYFLNDFGQAERIIKDLSLPNLKLQFDFYHCQILHGDVIMRLRALVPIIGHIQIASVPDRNEPDLGELNFPVIFSEIEKSGYSGPIGCEYRPKGKTLDGLGWLKELRR
ncbi:2-oxo-tetronate isomerase [Terrarubrum flagellatum]|uniref:2-oxo-tetronate isomerase n=1 Tax=Terrirubrum flagellatum TaxID=2895980 RepID=UPI0031451EED